MRNFTLTPAASTTVFGATDARFECDHCGHTELFTGARYFDQYHVQAWDSHYQGECPEVREILPVR